MTASRSTKLGKKNDATCKNSHSVKMIKAQETVEDLEMKNENYIQKKMGLKFSNCSFNIFGLQNSILEE